MMHHGTYKLSYRSPAPQVSYLDPLARGLGRAQRIVDSLRCEISNSEYARELRIRQVFTNPREIFRIEFEVPEMNYQRTTLLDRDALEELLEVDEIRALLREPIG